MFLDIKKKLGILNKIKYQDFYLYVCGKNISKFSVFEKTVYKKYS